MTATGIIICPTTCWDCKFDYHNPEPHPWWDGEDMYYAIQTGQPLPSGHCGCYCSRNAVKELKIHEEKEALDSTGDFAKLPESKDEQEGL